MLIGITGRLGSGKDTVYQRLTLLYGHLGIPQPQRRAFADPLKDSACALLGIDRARMEELKRDDDIGLAWVYRDQDLEYDPEITMRTFLQRYGTEAHRDIFGDDFWVKATLPQGLDHDDELIVITDCRFINEAERVRALGGYVVEVIGPDGRGDDSYDHASEKPLPISMDATIVNDVFDDDFATLDQRIVDALVPLVQLEEDWPGE